MWSLIIPVFLHCGFQSHGRASMDGRLASYTQQLHSISVNHSSSPNFNPTNNTLTLTLPLHKSAECTRLLFLNGHAISFPHTVILQRTIKSRKISQYRRQSRRSVKARACFRTNGQHFEQLLTEMLLFLITDLRFRCS